MTTMTRSLLAATLILSACPAEALAGGYCRLGWFRRPSRTTCLAALAHPFAPPAVVPSGPATPTVQAGDYAAALGLINAERARLGRGPLAWSATLASFAATNAGVHQPGSSGGAGQCWAGVFDPVHAARMWLASPPHWSILMGASAECGISRCPTGCTANAR
jgi:uncharacterized protein YkwD